MDTDTIIHLWRLIRISSKFSWSLSSLLKESWGAHGGCWWDRRKLKTYSQNTFPASYADLGTLILCMNVVKLNSFTFLALFWSEFVVQFSVSGSGLLHVHWCQCHLFWIISSLRAVIDFWLGFYSILWWWPWWWSGFFLWFEIYSWILLAYSEN